MSQEQGGFKNFVKLTRWVKYFLYIQIVVAIISIVSGTMENELLTDYQNNVYTSQEEAVADGEANDQRQGIIFIFRILVFIASGILILRWIYCANDNVRQLGAKEMTFTPGWSVGWYFVPIFNLWKPYQAMKEIWRASYSPSNWRNAVAAGSPLPWWWFLLLTTNFLDKIAYRISAQAGDIDIDIEELMRANHYYQAADLTSILLAFITLVIVENICKAQLSHIGVNT